MSNDGTQDPGPPPVLSDPVSGLVTGSRYEPEPLRVRVTEPPMPDISAVRRAMRGVLDDDSELKLDLAEDQPGTPPLGIPVQQAGSPAEPTTAAEPAPQPTPQPTPPTPQQAPATPPAGVPAPPPRVVQVPRGPEQPRVRRLIPPRVVERVRRLPGRIPRVRGQERPDPPPAAIRRRSSAGSVTAIMLLLGVIGVLVIVLFISLIDTISSIFT